MSDIDAGDIVDKLISELVEVTKEWTKERRTAISFQDEVRDLRGQLAEMARERDRLSAWGAQLYAALTRITTMTAEEILAEPVEPVA